MSTTFTYAGTSNQTYTLPAGSVSATVFMWGAGGGGGAATQEAGGAGAYLTGLLTFPSNATSYSIVVGQGGQWLSGSGNVSLTTYGGGGTGTLTSGGGRSAIQATLSSVPSAVSGDGTYVTYNTSTAHGLAVGQPIIISGLTPTTFNGTFAVVSIPSSTSFTVANTATGSSTGTGTLVAELVDVGGGGGGAAWGDAVGMWATYSGTAAGPSGYSGAVGGGGGKQTGGGAAGVGPSGSGVAGSILRGGAGASAGSGGGGGGYYGGGGGGNFSYPTGAGGGGSSYSSLLTNVSGANSTGMAAPGTGVTGYVSGVAAGGPGQTAGGNGLVIIAITPPTCFTAESNLLTPTGYKSAADIHTGDLLMTADGRKVPVKAYKAIVMGTEVSAPFLIKKDALGMGCPKADLRLSPWHAIQMNNGLWMKPQSFSELFPGSVQQYDIGKMVTYYHFEAPNFFKDNLVCDGTVVESYGGDQLDNVKGRVYNYDSKLKAYTRISGKPAAKKMLL